MAIHSKFSIRKLSVGVASILIGTLLLAPSVNAQEAPAENPQVEASAETPPPRMTQVEITHRATTQDGFRDTDEPIYSDEGNPDHSINVTPGLPVTVEAPTWGLYRGLPARIENHNWRNLSNTTRVTFTPDESTSVHTINYDVVNSAHRGLIGKVENKPDVQLYRDVEATSPAEDVEELEFSEPSSHSLPSTVYDRDGRIYDAIGETTYSRDTPNYYLGQRDDIHVVHYRERVQTLKLTDSPKRELEPNAVVTRYQYEDGRDIESPTVSDTFGEIKDFEGTRLVYDVMSPENGVQVKTYYYTATTTSKSVETPPSINLPDKVVTRYINEDMEEIAETQVGDTAGDNFDIRGYYFDRTQRDPEDPNIVTHVYHPLHTPNPDPQFPEYPAPDESRNHVEDPNQTPSDAPSGTPGDVSSQTPANVAPQTSSDAPSGVPGGTSSETSGSVSSETSETVTPNTGSTATVAPSTGSTETVAPSTGSTETVVPSTGSTETVVPSNGSTETVAPSTGSTETVAPQTPGNGSTETVTPNTGSTGTVTPSNGSTETVTPQTPSTGTTENVAPQTPEHGSSETVGSQTPGHGSAENVGSQTPGHGSTENVGLQTPGHGSSETVGSQTPGHGSTQTPDNGSTETPDATTPQPPTNGSTDAPGGSTENVGLQTPSTGSSENVAPQTPGDGSTENVGPQTPGHGSTDTPSTGSTENVGSQTPSTGSTETPETVVPQTPGNGSTERPETVTPTSPQPETPLGGNPSETPNTPTPSRPEPETPSGHPGFDVRVSIKGPVLVQEDLPELVVTEKGESTKADELPELVVTEKGESTKVEDLPELVVTDKGESTKAENLPELVVTDKGESTKAEDLLELVVTEKGEGTTQEDLPELVVTEKGESTTQEDLPELVVTEKGESTKAEELPELVVTEKGESTTQEDLPQLVVTEKGESTTQEDLPQLIVTDKGEIFTLYHTEGPQGQPFAYGRVEALVQPDLDPLTFNNPSDMVNEPLVCAKGQPAVQDALPELVLPDTEQPASQEPSDEPRSEQPTVSTVEQGSDQSATTNEKPYAKPTVLSGASPLPHTGEAVFNLLPLSLAFLGLGFYFLRKP